MAETFKLIIISKDSIGTEPVFVDCGTLTFTEIKVSNWASGGGAIYQIKINGEILVDSGSFGDNGFYLSFDPEATGANYSQDLSCAPGFQTVFNASNPFKGLGTSVDAQASAIENSGAGESNAIIFTPAGGLSYTKSVEVYHRNAINNSNGFAKLNGDTAVSGLLGEWLTVATGSGTITSLATWVDPASGAGENALRAIRIDGVDLVDHSSIGVDASGQGNNFETVDSLQLLRVRSMDLRLLPMLVMVLLKIFPVLDLSLIWF